ncbi:MAG: GNAT family N-acetyltransferase [bacterium]|nr:GNAT family N-acetyltransferase [bacterium]
MSTSNGSLSYVHANANDREHRDGFVAVYKHAFGGPPYNEVYSEDQVEREIWLPHLQNGVISLAIYAEKIIGFGCGLPLEHAPEDIRSHLVNARDSGAKVPDFSDTWYFSEFGVLEEHRRRGIGTQLVGQVLAGILLRGNFHYVMRTASEGSNSRHIFESIGSDLLPGTQDVSGLDQVKINQSQSNERVYLCGRCAQGLAKIFLRQ